MCQNWRLQSFQIVFFLLYHCSFKIQSLDHSHQNHLTLLWTWDSYCDYQDCRGGARAPSGTFFSDLPYRHPQPSPLFHPIRTPELKTVSESCGKAQPDCLDVTQLQGEGEPSSSFPQLPSLGKTPLLSLAKRKQSERQGEGTADCFARRKSSDTEKGN